MTKMDYTLFLSALTVGFLGSFHCIGMCGPLALALPKTTSAFSGRIVYNLGRVVTYSVLGLIAGLAGYGFSIQGFQKDLSILAGVVIIAFVFLTSGSRHLSSINIYAAKLSLPLKKKFRFLYGKGTLSALLGIGMLNGLLPCGFVYLALAGAVASGKVGSGIIYMSLFGLGTIPAMLAVSISGHFLGIKFQRFVKKASPVIAILLGVLLVYRGSELKKNSCCEKAISLMDCKK
jgi:sulfite exporter TauE/SafE